ncbi:hypothetical protein L6452_15030 [Arctium lappa]|uniref:Uncharacterized protein n=1 Tax=Arctium lappa TaxID=4217 RepID=A0ACB9CMM9_ARCLA|nr:hypothetical protein L6452_15030 [Arctium lappa]
MFGLFISNPCGILSCRMDIIDPRTSLKDYCHRLSWSLKVPSNEKLTKLLKVPKGYLQIAVVFLNIITTIYPFSV